MRKLEDLSLTDVIIFSLTIVTLIIGIDQVLHYKNYVQGMTENYWIFSISLILLIFYNLRKPPGTATPASPPKKIVSSAPKSAAKSLKPATKPTQPARKK